MGPLKTNQEHVGLGRNEVSWDSPNNSQRQIRPMCVFVYLLSKECTPHCQLLLQFTMVQYDANKNGVSTNPNQLSSAGTEEHLQ